MTVLSMRHFAVAQLSHQKNGQCIGGKTFISNNGGTSAIIESWKRHAIFRCNSKKLLLRSCSG